MKSKFPLILGSFLCLLSAPVLAQAPIVEGSGTEPFSNPLEGPVWFDYRWRIKPNGLIEVTLSNLRSDPDLATETSRATKERGGAVRTPLAYRFMTLQLLPVVDTLKVDQQKDQQGKVTSTSVDFKVKARIHAVAKRQQKTTVGRVAASAWEWATDLFSGSAPGSSSDANAITVDRYGPTYEVNGDISLFGGGANSVKYPALNAIPKQNFRIGTLAPAEFRTSLPPTGEGEFPNRTYLQGKAGMVRIKKAGGDWTKAEANMDLAIGDMVKTLSDGKAQVILAGTSVIRVKPDSEFIIPADPANTKEKVSFIQMVKGVLWAKARKENDSLKVATPNAICGVRGTEFTVQVKKEDRAAEVESWAHCYEGSVLMTPTKRPSGSRPGQRDDLFAARLLTADKVPMAAVGPQGFLDIVSHKHPLTIFLNDPVSGKPAVGARVAATTPITGAPWGDGTVGSDGKVVLRLAAGSYQISASYESPGGHMEGKTTVKVSAEITNEVNMALKSMSGPVAGIADKPQLVAILVEDDAEHPIPTARLLVRRQGESVGKAIRQATDAKGRTTIELPQGKYDVVASADRYKTKGTTIEVTMGRSNQVKLVLQASVTPTPTQPGGPMRVAIIVEDDAEHPIPTARILVRRQGDPAAKAVHQTTDRSGRATVELPLGKYDVVASADHFKTKGTTVEVTTGRGNQAKLILQASVSPTPSQPGSPLRVAIIVEDDEEHPIPTARLIVRRQGDPAAQPVQQATDRSGHASFDLQPGKYDVTTSAQRYKSKATVVDVATNRSRSIKLVLKRQDDSQPAGSGSFVGEWDVYNYSNTAATGQPTNRERWRISLSRSAATAQLKVGNKWMTYCTGPLTENGQVWNARREAGGVLVQQFDNLRLASDGNRFAGTWHGAAPHGFAFVGFRAGTAPEIPIAGVPTKPPSVPVGPKPPVVPVSPQTPAAPKRVVVELSEKNRQSTVNVGPKDTVVVKVATYAGTGYRVVMVPPPATLATLVAGPRDEPMQRAATTKVLVGSGTWKVYDFQVAPGATGSGSIKFRMIGPGRQSSETQYSVTLQVSTPTRSGGTP